LKLANSPLVAQAPLHEELKAHKRGPYIDELRKITWKKQETEQLGWKA
jgi:hypothetical protein